MIKKFSFHELREIFDEVRKIPERLDEMNIVQLKELHHHLAQRKSDLMPTVMLRLQGENHPDSGMPKHLEYCKANCSQFGMSVEDLEYWLSVLLKRINGEPHQTNFDNSVFADFASHLFFNSLFDEWLNQDGVPFVAVHYVYRKMSYKTPENIDEKLSKTPVFTIVGTQLNFAKYWNKFYKTQHSKSSSFPIKENGNVSLKTFGEIGDSIDRFHTRFNSILMGFQGMERNTL